MLQKPDSSYIILHNFNKATGLNMNTDKINLRKDIFVQGLHDIV